MTELQVILDFECYSCSHSVGVTLKCAGEGLSEDTQTVAAVNVPCPTCGAINKLYFEPNGTVRAISPYRGPRQLPEPSMN